MSLLKSTTHVSLDLQRPNYVTVYATQNDRLSRYINAELHDGAASFTLPNGAGIAIAYRKPDGTGGFYDTLEDGSSAFAVETDGTVTFGLAEQALTAPGAVPMELRIYLPAAGGGARLTTWYFVLQVGPSVLEDAEIVSSDYYNVLTDKITQAQQLWTQIQAGFGAPLTSTSLEAMTDGSKVYVYVGTDVPSSTPPMVFGHWYYWDGFANQWRDGGVYQSAGVDIDATLSQPGVAADAQKTGALAAPVFSSATAYTIGQHVLYQGTLYVFTADHAAGAWIGTDAAAVTLGGEIGDLAGNFETETALVDPTGLSFSSGTIASTGAVNTTTKSKIRTNQGTAPLVRKGDFYESDENYEIRVAIYTSRTMQASSFVEFVNAFRSGRVYIPDSYAGKYASVLIQKRGATSSDISADVPTIGEHVKHYSNSQFVLDSKNLRQSVVVGTDINLLDPLSKTESVLSGVTFTPNIDGTFSVSGTATSTANKEIRANAMNNWPFEPGKRYRASIEGNTAGSYMWLRMFKRVNGALVNTAMFATKSSMFFTFPADAEGYAFWLTVYSGKTVDNTIRATVQKELVAESVSFRHKIAFFGDSIMLGANGSSETEGQWTPYTIPQTVAHRLGLAYDNYGVSSMGYVTKGSKNQNAYERISETPLDGYTAVVLCFGVNDGFQTIGTFDSTDETTCLGQFNKIINYLGTNFPNNRIIVVGPYNGRNAGTFPKYWYGTPGGNANSRGVLSDTLKQACEYYNIPFIDQKNGPINGYSIQTLIGADGVHPCNEGYRQLGGWLSGEIGRLIG